MHECGRRSRLSFEVKQCRGRVNEKERDITTDMKEMRRVKRFQKVMEKRLNQLSPEGMIGVTDRHPLGTHEWVSRQLS